MTKARAPWGDPRPTQPPSEDASGIDHLVHKIISEAKTVGQAMAGLERLVSWLGGSGGAAGEKVDTSEVRAWIEQVGKRHANFQRFLAPRGWALSPTLQLTGHYIIVARALELEALTPRQADIGLAHWVLEHGDLENVLNRMASVPLRGVWRWTWIAGEAIVATKEGSYALASYGWLVIAEGMWRDLEEHRIGSRPRGFYAKSKKSKPKRFGAQLAWSEESLIAAHAVLAEDNRAVMTEPTEEAMLNRHGFLHGNVAGVIPIHHAVKAFTIVDAMLELAEAYVAGLDDSRLELPPWQGDKRIEGPSTAWVPVPGIRLAVGQEEDARENWIGGDLMTWKRVRRSGGGEGMVEVEPISGAVIGPASSWFLVPEDEAAECCRRVNGKPPTEPENDPHQGYLIVPADHVEEAHPEHMD